ncbi:MAG: hypothetical protein VSS75_001025 [Candidatus Parabeggiatoa sp.]|nr:hypothetical protein [Candidatus Parabeggiatoa sp.]
MCLRALDGFIECHAEPRLVVLQRGVRTALQTVAEDYRELKQASDWLHDISDLLKKKEDEPHRTSTQVKRQMSQYFTKMRKEARTKTTKNGVKSMKKITKSYAPGLYHTYHLKGLPSTNNELEGSFREYKRYFYFYLLRTTGLQYASRRLITRCGAWEMLRNPHEFWETTAKKMGQVCHNRFKEERERVKKHRERFNFHTRGASFLKAKYDKLKEIWENLKPKSKPKNA